MCAFVAVRVFLGMLVERQFRRDSISWIECSSSVFDVWENMTGKCGDLEAVHARPVRDRSSLHPIPSEGPARATEKRCAGYSSVGMVRLDVDGHNSFFCFSSPFAGMYCYSPFAVIVGAIVFSYYSHCEPSASASYFSGLSQMLTALAEGE